MREEINKIEKIFKTIPDACTLYPRDDQNFSNSHDYLFIARVLSNWKCGIVSLNIYKDKTYTCCLADKIGILYHPVTGLPIGEARGDFRCLLKKSTVKNYIRKKFFSLRSFITNNNGTDRTIIIGKNRIYNDGKLSQTALDHLNENIKWKLFEGTDIRANFIEHLYVQVEVIAGESMEKKLICPVDGPVTPINGDHKSPQWTWDHLCGRHYGLVLCPHCLGVFYMYLRAMS